MPRGDPACLVCREKCRRCDRVKPACGRCAARRLSCAYPTKFQFQSTFSPVSKKKRNTEPPVFDHIIYFENETPLRFNNGGEADEDTWEGFSPHVDEHDSVSFQGTIQQDSPSYEESPYSRQENDALEINNLLMMEQTQRILAYYTNVICPHQIVLSRTDTKNPYRSYILPLAYEQLGLLCAVLGLSACHMALVNGETNLLKVADKYRLKCIGSLIQTIQNIVYSESQEDERDALFATIQLLLLHDICESGISTHGAHITGAMSICNQLQLSESLTSRDERAIFFLGNLAWLDVIRSLSDPSRLCFSSELRRSITALSTPRFEQVNGCPRDLFLMIGEALECAKSYALSRTDQDEYRRLVTDIHLRINAWQLPDWGSPEKQRQWDAVGEGFRHALLIYTARLVSPEQPAEASSIQESVTAVLDAVSQMSSPVLEVMIMPLFIAGTDALSLYSRHYVLLRLDSIRHTGGFSNDLPKGLLRQVWEARGNQPKHDLRNILWTSFTDRTVNDVQNDYLII